MNKLHFHNCDEFLIAGTLCVGYTPATYRTRDGKAFFKFGFAQVGNHVEVDILKMPDYQGRSDSLCATCRAISERGGYKIPTASKNIHSARECAVQWAECVWDSILNDTTDTSLWSLSNLKNVIKDKLNFGSNKTNYYLDNVSGYYYYYSGYDVNTFFRISELQQKIKKSHINSNLLNAAVFWFTNVERKKYNMRQFQFHNKLKQMAISHSEQMKFHNFFGHDNPFDARYRTLSDRLDSVNGGFMCCGENIADYPIVWANERFTIENRNGTPRLFSTNGREIFPYTYYDFAKIVVQGWMNSPGHRANILNPEYMYLGCGCAGYEKQGNGYSTLYFKLTQNFGGTLLSWWQ